MAVGAINATGARPVMTGLRPNDPTIDERFLTYFSIVQEAAADLGCVFFLFCGEGHDLITYEIDCQDLTGWLVPFDEVADFEPIWRADNWKYLTAEQSDFMVTAIWSGVPGEISVKFEPIP